MPAHERPRLTLLQHEELFDAIVELRRVQRDIASGRKTRPILDRAKELEARVDRYIADAAGPQPRLL